MSRRSSILFLEFSQKFNVCLIFTKAVEHMVEHVFSVENVSWALGISFVSVEISTTKAEMGSRPSRRELWNNLVLAGESLTRTRGKILVWKGKQMQPSVVKITGHFREEVKALESKILGLL